MKLRNFIPTALAAFVLGALGTAGAADIHAGKASSAVCAGCHGANGEGNGPNPPLAGMAADRFVQAINDYKSGKRPNAAMKSFASQLKDTEAANLAAYYASLKKK
jgi:cytochrome c553